jgi:ankyrin repeat protein
MVVFLQGRGADLSARPESPLLLAVDYGDVEKATSMSRTMLANASDPNVRRADGRSALQLAAARGYAEIAELLIHRGAVVTADDVAAATGDAGPVLRRAAAIERVHFDRRYIQDLHGKPVVRDDSNGLPWTLVNQLASVAHFDFAKVKELLGAHPALLNTRASWDESAIEAAAHMGLVPMAEWLADRGYAISTCTAVLLGLDGVVKQAIAADRLSIYERGAHDIGILAFAAYGKEQAAIAEILLKAGANVHARCLGITPLHLVANKGYVDIGALLIEHGADVNCAVKARDGMVTPLAMAIKAKQPKMEALLRQHGAV